MSDAQDLPQEDPSPSTMASIEATGEVPEDISHPEENSQAPQVLPVTEDPNTPKPKPKPPKPEMQTRNSEPRSRAPASPKTPRQDRPSTPQKPNTVDTDQFRPKISRAAQSYTRPEGKTVYDLLYQDSIVRRQRHEARLNERHAQATKQTELQLSKQAHSSPRSGDVFEGLYRNAEEKNAKKAALIAAFNSPIPDSPSKTK